MQVSGEVTIFRNEHDSANGKFYTYTVGVGGKKQDGTWVNAYMDAKFKKGIIVENKTRIDIKDGFVSAREYTTKNGETVKKPEVVILDFDIKVGEQAQTGFAALRTDDVPF